MTERRASMGDKVYRGDVVKYIRTNISLGTFMKRTIKTADEACWDLCNKLNFVPAVKEEPERQTGTWRKMHHEHGFECSWCGWESDATYNFCPNCGADMKGEQDGSER